MFDYICCFWLLWAVMNALVYTVIWKANHFSASISTASWLNNDSMLLIMLFYIETIACIHTTLASVSIVLTLHTHTHTLTYTLHTCPHIHTHSSHMPTLFILFTHARTFTHTLHTCPHFLYSSHMPTLFILFTHAHTYSSRITPRTSYGHQWTNSFFVRRLHVSSLWAHRTSPLWSAV